jgi:hypothetical protein
VCSCFSWGGLWFVSVPILGHASSALKRSPSSTPHIHSSCPHIPTCMVSSPVEMHVEPLALRGLLDSLWRGRGTQDEQLRGTQLWVRGTHPRRRHRGKEEGRGIWVPPTIKMLAPLHPPAIHPSLHTPSLHLSLPLTNAVCPSRLEIHHHQHQSTRLPP